jgi:hypothetical protein
MDVSKITKEQFDLAYNKFQPNAWIKFGFKYFSTSTLKENFKIRKSVTWVLGVLFGVGFLATVMGLPHNVIAIPVLTYAGILVALAIMMGGAALMNNWRIKKVQKELGVNIWQYEALVNMFYPTPTELVSNE